MIESKYFRLEVESGIGQIVRHIQDAHPGVGVYRPPGGVTYIVCDDPVTCTDVRSYIVMWPEASGSVEILRSLKPVAPGRKVELPPMPSNEELDRLDAEVRDLIRRIESIASGLP